MSVLMALLGLIGMMGGVTEVGVEKAYVEEEARVEASGEGGEEAR